MSRLTRECLLDRRFNWKIVIGSACFYIARHSSLWKPKDSPRTSTSLETIGSFTLTSPIYRFRISPPFLFHYLASILFIYDNIVDNMKFSFLCNIFFVIVQNYCFNFKWIQISIDILFKVSQNHSRFRNFIILTNKVIPYAQYIRGPLYK